MPAAVSRIHAVINPAAGKDEPILNKLNDVFNELGVSWDISLTHKSGDATRMARQAAEDGAEIVMGYGGDGTQMEIANGLMGTGVPLGILPGGTANAMAFEMGVPRALAAAARALCESTKRRQIDIGEVGGRYFMLRAYTGLQEEQRASREMKDRYGSLAYIADLAHTMAPAQKPVYHIEVNGEVHEAEGFTCLILNAGSLGTVSVSANTKIDISDGLLDVFIVDNKISSLRSLTSFYLDTGKTQAQVSHWQGSEVTVEVDPPQEIWIDGESLGPTPFTARVLPQALEMVVPE